MKKIIRKILYLFSFFNYVKCVDCKWNNKGCNVYCKPPLDLCVFEPKSEEKDENTKRN